MTVALMMNIGDVASAIASPTGQPYVYVLQQTTDSYGATMTLTVVVAIIMTCSGINQVTTSSRQLFAFARDQGLPFSNFLGKVNQGSALPVNSVVVSLIVAVLLSLIIIGSNEALSQLITLSLTGLISSYFVAIACILHRRTRGATPLPPSRFNLGWWGNVVNSLALAWLSIAFVMMFFPATPKPSPADMNWSVVIYSVVVLFALGYYRFIARYKYKGPVAVVRKDI